MWKWISFAVKYIICPVAWMLAWSPGGLTGRFIIPLNFESGSVWLSSLEYVIEFPNNSEIRHWDVRTRAREAQRSVFLACCLSTAKLHSFYLRYFKSFWLNIWTPPIKMPSRSPHKCITHTYMNGHLWSTQMSDGTEPWPFRMSQVGKKAACIF